MHEQININSYKATAEVYYLGNLKSLNSVVISKTV